MQPCITDKFLICEPQVDKRVVLETAVEVAEALEASPYDIIGVAIAFGADPQEARRVFRLEISGNLKKPVGSFLASYGKTKGYERVEKELLKFYRAMQGCLCPAGPIAPLEKGYIVQRPHGIYICNGTCREIAPEPIVVYDHPQGCMFYNPPLVLNGQPIAAISNALKQLKVSEPDLVARYLLPGLCRELRGVKI